MMRLGLILAVLLGLAIQAVPASADMVYTLNCNAAPCVNPNGNYGSVTLSTISSTVVRVTVDLTTAAVTETFANSGAGYAIAWDITTSTKTDPSLDNVAINALTPNPGNFAVQSFASGGNYKAAPFTSGANGNGFNYAINYTGATGTDNKLVFDVTLGTGLILDNFVTNPNYRFASDISIQGNTFNVASNGGGTRVPEPQTWLMLLAGLLFLPMLQRRLKLARVV